MWDPSPTNRRTEFLKKALELAFFFETYYSPWAFSRDYEPLIVGVGRTTTNEKTLSIPQRSPRIDDVSKTTQKIKVFFL
jgi:hypothetical protein